MRIESLHQSADGTLWVGTRSGLARLVKDHFEPLPIRLEKGAIAEGIVGRQGIVTNARGELFLATERGLVRGAQTKGAWQFTAVAAPATQRDGPVVSVLVDEGGKVWFGCGTGLCLLDQNEVREVGREAGLPDGLKPCPFDLQFIDEAMKFERVGRSEIGRAHV